MFVSLKNEINIIVRFLLQQFKILFNIIINAIIHEKYIMKNVVNERKLQKYVYSINKECRIEFYLKFTEYYL